MTAVTVLGLGEAGRLYALGLAEAGADVRGYDPYTDAREAGIHQFGSLADSVDGTDLVISLVGAAAARSVAEQALPLLPANAVFADFNTAGPEDKAGLAELAAGHGVDLVDVAVMAPVPRAGSRTPLLVSGTAADRFAALMEGFGSPVETIPGAPGAAAGRKLLRSVFMKGLAGLVLECRAAGRAAGAEEWLLAEIAGELGPDGPDLVTRLLQGSQTHAVRRAHEVEDSLAYLRGLGTPAWMTEGTFSWLSALAADGAEAD
ncbi:NAD(P)-dependent oxidoreductase [Arthrobacter sp. zg-Y238]|uniref:DUF1932 domain-containing protein n=1 Tax=Arthrobacter sp. zg-Y238 TaxID=2964614 RepID=UPI0021067D3F|nr:NAD(P)-dependent oxidoreductase [Arthrobacter sp. zg-Y238]MCQ1953956.1 NAD(P)-binding domain-containing protein [Arthrobacter sp. zg-Y238]